MIEIEAVIAVVKTTKKLFLFLKRDVEDFSYPSLWCFPGGKIDPGESAIDAVVRELYEETGIKETEIIDIFLRGEMESPLPRRNRVYKIKIFEITVSSDIKVQLSHEHSEYKIISPKVAFDLDLAKPVTESIVRSLIERANI